MKIPHKDASGFTLVEMMMVLGIFAIVSGALYTFYLTHLRNASHHDQLLEVQQNMRIAMDSISRDLMMSGMLIPNAFSPLQGSYSSSVILNTSSSDRVFARITHANRMGIASFKNLTTSVDTGSSLAFNVGDVVRIVRPAFTCSAGANNEPLRCQYPMGDYSTLVVASPPASGVMGLTRAKPTSAFDSGINLNEGDMIAKKGGYSSTPSRPATPDTVLYYLSRGNGCPTGQSCLFRSVNGAQPGDVVAGYLQTLRFTYNSAMVAGQSTTVSIGVKLVGTTTQPSGPKQQLVTREMDTLIKLRQ